MKKTILAACVAIIAACQGCSNTPAQPQSIVPLYSELASFAVIDSARAVGIMRTDSLSIRAMTQVLGADSAVTYPELVAWSHSLPVTIFTPAVDSIFPSLLPVEQALGGILQNAAQHDMQLPPRTYTAVVWGNRHSIVFNEPVMLIALNHYLGAEYPGYAHWPSYARLDKKPERLPYDMAEALTANKYPFEKTKAYTTLSRLLYEGALIYAKTKLVPQASLAEALGYSPEQLEWCEKNQPEIWLKLVAADLLYDTDESTAERLVAPAPNTGVISTYTPGRLGRFIGYRIVCEYLDNERSLTIPELLSPTFYDNPDILKLSRYSGE